MIRRNSSLKLGSGGNKITIRLLDDNEVIQLDFQSHHKGQFLMDYVCRQLNIAEKDYFGLRYVDSNKQRHWLDLGKSILKQLKEMTPYIVCVRFKFYPCDPMVLKEEVSKYQLVLQLRRDILHGRLYSTISDMAILASYIIQSELGDFDPDLHRGNYVAEFELVSRQSSELEEKVIELHQKLKGVTAGESDVLFLKKAATLDTYGVDPHPVKDQQGDQLYLGINHTGISTFEGSKKSTHFKWSQITKLNYEAKMFIVHISIAEDSRTKKKETVGFKCQTSSSCKYLWRCAVEQRLFYNCGCTTDIPAFVRGGGIFGSRFKYSGRVQREILEDPGPLRASDLAIQRTPLYRSLQRNKTRSLPHSPLQLGYGSLPRSNHSAPPHESTRLEGALGTLGSSTSLPLSTLSSPYCPEHQLPLLETLPEDSPRGEEKEESKISLMEEEQKENVALGNATTDPALYVSTTETPTTESELFIVTSFERSTSMPSPSQSSPKVLLSISEETESDDDKDNKEKSPFSPPPDSDAVFNESSEKPRLTRGFAFRESSLSNGHIPITKDTETEPVSPVKARLRKVAAIDMRVGEIWKEEPKRPMSLPPLVSQTLQKTSILKKSVSVTETKSLRKSDDAKNSNSDGAKNLDTNENSDVAINSDQMTDSNENTANNTLIATTTTTTTTTASTVSSSSSESESISVKPAFQPYQQEQEDGYEVVPNDTDHLLRESRIDQVASQAQTPVAPPTSTLSSSSNTANNKLTPGQGHGKMSTHAFLSIGKIFIVCLICVLIALVSVAILAIELDIDICRKMRKIPEVEMFQNELYEPIKHFIWSKFHFNSVK